jgi:hypothetical protein
MKIESLARPSLIALGLVGVAATALLGFAAGVAVSRDPEAVRRTARRVARAAAVGLERATLMSAQARERLGDLWAEARDAAVADVDDADFKRADAEDSTKQRRAAATQPTEKAGAAAVKKPARKRSTSARKPRVQKSAASTTVRSESASA